MIISTFLVTLLALQTPDYKSLPLENKIEVLAEKFEEDPFVARAIICAESRNDKEAVNRNLDKHGEVWSRDWSYFQVNDYFHREDARKLGLDIKDPDDNLVYGFYILSKQGTKPWGASKKRWQKMIEEKKISCDKIDTSQIRTVAQL